MLTVDESCWPLVVARWQAPVCGCDFELYQSRFEAWLSRGEPFSFVSVTSEPVVIPACLLRRMGQWLHQRRDIVARLCAGLAGVFPESALPEPERRTYGAAVSRQLGCEAAAFRSEASAIAWAVARLRAGPIRDGHALAVPAVASQRFH